MMAQVRLPVQSAIIAHDKLREYLLSVAHPDGHVRACKVGRLPPEELDTHGQRQVAHDHRQRSPGVPRRDRLLCVAVLPASGAGVRELTVPTARLVGLSARGGGADLDGIFTVSRVRATPS